jgi:hypothetical protein
MVSQDSTTVLLSSAGTKGRMVPVNMISALIFVISVAALGQFALFSWRAAFLTVASREVSLETRAAMGSAASDVEDGNFAGASKWLELSPNLAGEDRRLWTVKLYFVALRAIAGLSRMMAPAGDWSQREMVACARYAAIVVEERLQRNRLVVAEMRSF